MPQMSPISWLFLFLFFTCIFILINMVNYFIYYPMNNKSNNKKINMMKLNWKW